MTTKKANAILLDILAQPQKSVPSLGYSEIRKVLIYTIRLYQKNKISLDTLATITKSIQTHKACYLQYDLLEIIKEISTYSVISEVLADMLDELAEMKERHDIIR